MSDSQKASRWKAAVTIVTFLALAGTTYALRDQLSDTFDNLRDANLWIVAFVVPLAACNHALQARIYQGLYRIFGDRFRTKPMVRLSLELNFVNNILPSGGVSGFSYLGLRMRGEGVPAGRSTLVQMLRFVTLFVAMQFMMAIGVLLLAVDGDVNSFVMLVAGSLGTLLLIGTVGAAYVVGSKRRINAFFKTVTKIINRVIHVARPKHPETISIDKVERVFTELHENYNHLKRNVTQLKWPLLFAAGTILTEVAAIFCVFLGFGEVINPGAIIIAYAVANFAGLVSVLPGGVGIYEGLMTGVFAAAGVSAGLALPVVIAYRVLSMGVQLPVGYYFYQNSVRHQIK